MEIMPTVKTEEIVKEFYDTMMCSYAKHTLNYAELRQEINNDNVRLLPISYEGKVIATSSLFIDKFDPNGNPYYGSVHRLTVNPKFRGRDLGILANKNVLEYAKQIGCKQVHCGVLINIEDMGGGNNPNLAELNICLNKFSYKPTGFRLVDLPDFSRVDDLQFTSTAVLWKQIGGEDKSHAYELDLQNLMNYYNNSNNFKILDVSRSKLHIYPPKKTGAILASSTNIDDFKGSEYLPSYFLPFYSDNLETVYFGFKYKKIMTRASQGPNVADINYQLLTNELNNVLLIKLLIQIQERIVQRSNIAYSDPIVKKNNI